MRTLLGEAAYLVAGLALFLVACVAFYLVLEGQLAIDRFIADLF